MSAFGTSPAAYPPGYLDENCGGTPIAIATLFIVLEAVFVLLRFYARHRTATSTGWDDVLILASWFANLASVTNMGFGRHLVEVLLFHPEQVVLWLKSLYAVALLYLMSVALPKISIVALYLRIFTSRAARLTCYIVIFVIVANWVSFIFASTFSCSPVAYQWDKTITGGTCFNMEAAFKASGAPNIATDAIIMVLPIPTSFFLAETFVDDRWASVTLVGWCIAEAGLHLIAACLIALRPVFSTLPLQWLKSRLYASLSPRTPSDRHGSGPGFHRGGLPPSQSRSGFTEIETVPDDEPVGRGAAGTNKSLPLLPRERREDVEKGVGLEVSSKAIRVKDEYIVTTTERRA
ncbi:hypothetical protein MMC13_001657 [Lambiella insularis]|nr:hypothetical protein [Lambiella insularis]